jgi:hypothetical protein
MYEQVPTPRQSLPRTKADMDVVEPDETDDVVGELNIDNAERRTWLLKIPESLDEVRLGRFAPRTSRF